MHAISNDAMREFDSQAVKYVPELVLMENAAVNMAAWLIRRLVGDASGSIRILAGKGNNGGDALAVARQLSYRGFKSTVFYIQPEQNSAASTMLKALEQSLVDICPLDEDGTRRYFSEMQSSCEADVHIDGLFGSGLTGPMSRVGGASPLLDVHSLVGVWNHPPATRVALDVPSGSWSGWIPDQPLLQSDVTLAVQFPRDFLYNQTLRDVCGEIQVVEAGFPVQLIEHRRQRVGETRQLGKETIPVLDSEYLSKHIAAFESSAHKGTRGKLALFGGSPGMEGAAILAGKSFLRSGGGMVRVFSRADRLDATDPALMWTRPEAFDPRWSDAILAGPGWGREDVNISQQRDILSRLMQTNLPLVIDADGLSVLKDMERNNSLPSGEGSHKRILTPHPAEAAMLLDVPTSRVLDASLESAAEISRRYASVVILKGSISLIAEGGNVAAIYDGAQPALGTAGTGDVLAGLTAAMLTRGFSPLEAACLAVVAHGTAGLRSFRRKGWFTATQLVESLSLLLSEFQYG